MSRVIVVYGGGFQPFHTGHLSSYLEAKQAFPDADFYVVASADVKQRPIPFEDKRFLATQAGVSPKDFRDVAVKNPLNPTEILKGYDPNQDIYILVRSERDPVPYTKKDGSPAYYQPYQKGGKFQPFGKHGYVFVTKKRDFSLLGQDVYSGTQVRNMYSQANDEQRQQMVREMYPRSKQQKTIKKLLDKYIGKSTMTENIIKLIQESKPLLAEATPEQRAKFARLIDEAMKKQQLEEAGSPAQQAAIAIAMKEKGQKPKNENIDNGEYNDEAGMADNNLETLKRAVQGLDNLIDAGDNLPEWCQEKIAVAKSMLVTVWDYMQSEEETSLEEELAEDWQKVNKRDKTDGMSTKAVKAYRRENPGSKLKTAVTTKPSKLKPGSKAAKRRKSFCARMSGMKKAHASAKTKRDPDSPINKALRRWNCESIEEMENLVMIAEQKLAEQKSKVIAQTAKDLSNPPKVMQHRAKRDQEREHQYTDAQRKKVDEGNDFLEEK